MLVRRESVASSGRQASITSLDAAALRGERAGLAAPTSGTRCSAVALPSGGESHKLHQPVSRQLVITAPANAMSLAIQRRLDPEPGNGWTRNLRNRYEIRLSVLRTVDGKRLNLPVIATVAIGPARVSYACFEINAAAVQDASFALDADEAAAFIEREVVAFFAPRDKNRPTGQCELTQNLCLCPFAPRCRVHYHCMYSPCGSGAVVAHDLAKIGAAGSNPVFRSQMGHLAGAFFCCRRLLIVEQMFLGGST